MFSKKKKFVLLFELRPRYFGNVKAFRKGLKKLGLSSEESAFVEHKLSRGNKCTISFTLKEADALVKLVDKTGAAVYYEIGKPDLEMKRYLG